ncbi:Sf3b5 [Symbiodinium sp. CCMP2592]|nr:Sf3b5 [Symbiodinium sp. CCMP2592]|mmetsp:Transcript_128741/g.181633  ORF Transcript_128741/g.181633 Transcript_128741/m.181633 type:complete len:102 (-) Transcript_128741:60-365(-)
MATPVPGQSVDLGVYDRFHVHAQMEHLQTKYHGTGGADTSKWEWATNIHRDTMASHVGHYTRLAYFALCENEPVARVRFNCLQAMIQPCGKPPLKADDMED